MASRFRTLPWQKCWAMSILLFFCFFKRVSCSEFDVQDYIECQLETNAVSIDIEILLMENATGVTYDSFLMEAMEERLPSCDIDARSCSVHFLDSERARQQVAAIQNNSEIPTTNTARNHTAEDSFIITMHNTCVHVLGGQLILQNQTKTCIDVWNESNGFAYSRFFYYRGIPLCVGRSCADPEYPHVYSFGESLLHNLTVEYDNVTMMGNDEEENKTCMWYVSSTIMLDGGPGHWSCEDSVFRMRRYEFGFYIGGMAFGILYIVDIINTCGQGCCSCTAIFLEAVSIGVGVAFAGRTATSEEICNGEADVSEFIIETYVNCVVVLFGMLEFVFGVFLWRSLPSPKDEPNGRRGWLCQGVDIDHRSPAGMLCYGGDCV